MNYLTHYNKLIKRSKNRIHEPGYERHHIIPKCMNGTDDKINLVYLTPEEHYVAHQLLIKIYPENHKLIHAAIMMTVESEIRKRRGNKLYGWLKRKLSVTVSQNQSGSGNSQYGKRWINNGKESIFLKPAEEIPEGFRLGRIFKERKCLLCESERPTYKSKYCDFHRKEVMKENGRNQTTHFTAESVRKSYKDKFFITNDIKDKLHKIGQEIPEGWRKGRTQNKHN